MTATFDPKTIQLKLFNTATRTKEALQPEQKNHVRMYTCGPTVYHYAHIGNFRTYVFEDLLRRTIKFLGMEITQVMNITDVDDKTIKGAIAKGISLKEYTAPFEKAFFQDLDSLNIEKAEKYPAATDYIEEMIKIIEGLLEKGVDYRGTDGSVYFAINKFPRYGCLSHLHLDELQSGASERVASDEYEKDHVADFVLWKGYDAERDGNIFWESPFGKGRPGWHLECSAMAMKELGETLDIHCGGVDNMFPHHENEIAQSEVYSGKQFSKVWLHSEHLIVDGKKMSKSLGNFYTLRDLLEKGFTGIRVRYLLLRTHYKTQLNFTFEGLDAAKHSLQRLDDFVQRLLYLTKGNESGEVEAVLNRSLQKFSEALADDLNISAALAAVFDMIREINTLIDQNKIGAEGAAQALALMKKINGVLGVIHFEKVADSIPAELTVALKEREEARQTKNWAKADQLRDLIISSGYLIEDTAEGARLKKAGV